MNIFYVLDSTNGLIKQTADIHITALKRSGHDLFVADLANNYEEKWQEHYKNLINYDCIIQHCHPFLYEYIKDLINIGIFHPPALNLMSNGWANRLSLLDGVLSYGEVEEEIHSHEYIPICYEGEVKENKKSDEVLRFYTKGAIGNFSLATVLQCYYTAFTRHDKVELNIYHHSMEEITKAAEEICSLTGFKPNNLPSVNVKNGPVDHSRNNVWLNLARFNDWCINSIEAYVNNNNSIMLDSKLPKTHTPLRRVDYILSKEHQFTGYEKWYYPNLTSIVGLMQEEYRKFHLKHLTNNNPLPDYTYLGQFLTNFIEKTNDQKKGRGWPPNPAQGTTAYEESEPILEGY